MMTITDARDVSVIVARKRRIQARKRRLQGRGVQSTDSDTDKLRSLIAAVRACTNDDEDTRNMSSRELFSWAAKCINKLCKDGKAHTRFIGTAVSLMHSLEAIVKSS